MINFIPCELHTHTKHSDGQFTVEDLMRYAKKEQLTCIALTDHNTFSGHMDITEEMRKQYPPVAFGIEWTTYFGHMVALGAREYVDWRDATPDTIDEKMKALKAVGGVIGVAHPFDLGDPMCTGCHWDFRVQDWNLPDYMEIWSGPLPGIQRPNQKALAFWTSLLNQGFRITATHGRDWHSYHPDHIDAVTYVGIDRQQPDGDAVIDGVRSGRTFVTLGPTISLTVSQRGTSYTIGDTVSAGACKLSVNVACEDRREIWGGRDISVSAGRIVANGETLCDFNPANPARLTAELPKGWLRAEIYGSAGDVECPVIVTSAIYVE